MNLKYYVLWKKDNEMISNYLNKYYIKLLGYLKDIKKAWYLIEEIDKLLSIENRNFILNADYSSVINMLYFELVNETPQYLWEVTKYLDWFKKEINIFLKEWIDSEKLLMNKWVKVLWTNIKLTDQDNNPYNVNDVHPDHIKDWVYSGSWWDLNQQNWLDTYERTFDLLKKVDLWIYEELNQIITKIVPLWTAKSMHNSASYKECIGHLYMWYTIDSDMPEINNLEAIIHESSHNKLNLIKQFDPIMTNSYEEIYYSAIRPDARHIHWVFIWYHAFAPTIYIVMKAYANWYLWNNQHWFEKIVLYHMKTKLLQKQVKKYAKLTKMWEEISKEIDYVITLMDDLLKKLNPSKEIIKRIKEKQIIHFKDVNKNYPHLQY